jgi:hypothetical protein
MPQPPGRAASSSRLRIASDIRLEVSFDGERVIVGDRGQQPGIGVDRLCNAERRDHGPAIAFA